MIARATPFVRCQGSHQFWEDDVSVALVRRHGGVLPLGVSELADRSDASPYVRLIHRR